MQGNIVALLDSAGNVVVKYVYDAWGNHAVLDANGNDITDENHIGNLNPFRYRGYFYDTETGLYYLQTRYYDPEVGRFITIDGIEYLDPETINGLNLYTYCGNNPVMNVDPSGMVLISLLVAIIAGAIAGAIIGGVYGATTAVANGQNVGMGILIGALSGLFLGIIAGVAGFLMAPLLTGAAAIGSLTAGASFTIGVGVAFAGGATVGYLSDVATQAVNNGGEIDWVAAIPSAIQSGVLTIFSAMFSSLASGFVDSFWVGIGSGIFISTFNMLFDIIKNFLSRQNSSSKSSKVYYGI